MVAETSPGIHHSFNIEVTDLSKRFNREWIFKDLTLSLHPGTTYAITGPNGSGKSTLLQILWGQMPPSSGKIDYFKDQQMVDPETLHHHLAIATPYMDLIEEFTLYEQIKFHFSLRSARSNMSVDEVINKMYLESSRDKVIGNFSSGMKQRVKLGLAFSTKADMIFLDEPGTNLDRDAFGWYLEMLNHLPKDVVTMIASNQPTEYPENALKIDILTFKPGYRS
jgi:ABC-type multidrug transport system ATPase subunit